MHLFQEHVFNFHSDVSPLAGRFAIENINNPKWQEWINSDTTEKMQLMRVGRLSSSISSSAISKRWATDKPCCCWTLSYNTGSFGLSAHAQPVPLTPHKEGTICQHGCFTLTCDPETKETHAVSAISRWRSMVRVSSSASGEMWNTVTMSSLSPQDRGRKKVVFKDASNAKTFNTFSLNK